MRWEVGNVRGAVTGTVTIRLSPLPSPHLISRSSPGQYSILNLAPHTSHQASDQWLESLSEQERWSEVRQSRYSFSILSFPLTVVWCGVVWCGALIYDLLPSGLPSEAVRSVAGLTWQCLGNNDPIHNIISYQVRLLISRENYTKLHCPPF